MDLPDPVIADSPEQPVTASGSPPLSSVALAMVEDQHRSEQARQAIQDAGEIQTWAVRFGLLGDSNRLKILLVLHRAPGITVGDLAATVGMSDNAASHALSALRIAGVVAAARDGRFRRWSIADQEIHDILHAVGASHSSLHPHH
jgi:DNA-binding transcriptional ArsR family regulator